MRELNLLVAERAEREGLLDVAYAMVDSPFGPLTAAATDRGLVMLAYPEHEPGTVLERLAGELSPRVLEAPARLDGVRRELDEYFEGRRREFETPVDFSLSRGFYRKVLEATARIGYGQTTTYAGRRGRRRQPQGGARGGQRAGLEPDPGGGALPPRAAHRRRAGRLHRRPGAQGVPAVPRAPLSGLAVLHDRHGLGRGGPGRRRPAAAARSAPRPPAVAGRATPGRRARRGGR